MTVIVVAACPVGLRGHLTRWLLEISAGVFVGKVSARVRDLLWIRTVEMVKSGRAIMVYSAQNEQGLAFKVHRHEWTPVEIEGLTLMLRPNPDSPASPASSTHTEGWSTASRRRRFRR
jgi:CRISPR-associated protein Cas2